VGGGEHTRADLIRQFYERKDTRNLAEVLIDLETDDVLRVSVIGLLASSKAHQPLIKPEGHRTVSGYGRRVWMTVAAPS
jgi:hypothetical protein